MRLAMIAHRLRLVALGALFALGLVSGARAQDNFPTPGGATVPAYVTMCLTGPNNTAIPCNPGGGGGMTVGGAVSGGIAGCNLFVTSSLQLGCVAAVTQTDTGSSFNSQSGVISVPTTGATQGYYIIGGARVMSAQGSQNFFAGPNSGLLAYTGTATTCVGESACSALASGNNNTVFGRFAAGALNGSANNSIVGSGAMSNAVTGLNNNIFGQGAAPQLNGGTGHIMIGSQTGGGIVTGADSVIIGRSLAGLNSALTNAIVLGSGAGVIRADFNNTTPNLWTFSSTLALPLATDATHTDATVCRDTISGQLFFGSGAAGICLGTSGRQFKREIEPMGSVLDDFMKLDFVTYRYRDGYGDNGARRQYGLIAQDVEKVWPELAGHNDNGETINYDMGAVWMKYGRAIQELRADNDNLRAELRALQAKVR